MKPFHIAVLVLALTYGTSAYNGGLQMSDYLENIKAKIAVGNEEMKDKAQSFLEERQSELEPLAADIQNKMKELQSAVTHMEDQIKPLTEQMQPLLSNLKQMLDDLKHSVVVNIKTSRK
ncbi:PREDICTED: type-4 ice-structuring protein-like [Cyprinodon variegatus]|uniref:type-4 ice-structuring protein-like n=1 Tax=Cyprinodon variegatus TaxID=28743 RepID=UPI000742C22E|nr:PREDICTED: type-4 ice-structuring protein-like [Cyprinodon variegatus]